MRIVGFDIQACSINAGCFFGGTDVTIGKDVFMNYQCFIDNAAHVEIGQECSFGPRVMIITGSHEVGNLGRRAGMAIALPVRIGSGSWLGANVVVLPGVTIGENVVIAAGALVTADCEPNALYAGVPAKKIKSLPH